MDRPQNPQKDPHHSKAAAARILKALGVICVLVWGVSWGALVLFGAYLFGHPTEPNTPTEALVGVLFVIVFYGLPVGALGLDLLAERKGAQASLLLRAPFVIIVISAATSLFG